MDPQKFQHGVTVFVSQLSQADFAIQGHPQWTNSWTTNSTATDVTGAFFQLDCTRWQPFNYYFDMVAKTDTGTAHYQVAKVSDSSVLTGSVITTTSTTPVEIRSGIITLPATSGVVQVKLQHWITGGDGSTQFVNSMMSRHVFEIIGNISG